MGIRGRYTADVRYPLTETLQRLFGSAKEAVLRGKQIQDTEGYGSDYRNEIVSDKLCDDTIEYLAPTLEQHKGCTLIDIHPGACLFSSKLHDFLKPKRHLLLEPEPLYYDSFIKPLLDRPNSTYRHSTIHGVHLQHYFHNYNKLLNDPELAPRQSLPLDDSRQRQLDPNFLVVGNLARKYTSRARTRSVTLASLILQQMLQASLNNEIFHNGGLVRMLWWVPEGDKYTLFPITEAYRRSLNARLSIATETTEAVGMLDLYNIKNRYYAARRPRPPFLSAMIADRVQKRMEAAGMKPPEGRDVLYERPEFYPSASRSPFESTISTFKELERDIESAQKRLLVITKDLPSVRRTAMAKLEESMVESITYPQCKEFHDNFDVRLARRARTIIYADLATGILNLEVALVLLEENGFLRASLDASRDAVKAMWDDMMAHAHSITKELSQMIELSVDMQIACFKSPPMVALEARAYQPLKGEVHEIWPKNQMMLLDMVPKGVDLSVPDLASRREGAKICEMLLRSFMESPAQCLPDALDRIAPNAAQDLLPMCPAVSDPRKGGRLDPRNIKTRSVSEEIMVELVKAWFEWPFKPSTVEMEIARAGSESASEEDTDVPTG
ncbi:hypothetical protein LTR78_002850 [Recurvomyces mirabilis]|uniref:Mitochondrial transcription factor 1 n=1 Tax=Recurvomyces mirabilis TaxID=574656 RepID=A0AAE0WT45_9PEZI|nr:hypothetical protein LTR78_002850 [Recurvomyces mirabilis]KAK5159417.1 hypothetical protein LTS14_002559 [Recurvomyces mirabilis]